MEILRPTKLEELEAMLRAGAEAKRRLRIEGGGSKRAWLRSDDAADEMLVTQGLDRILEHAHGDMTATVEAGVSLKALQAHLARKDQRVAIDPPLGASDEATLGGILSADDAGPSRFAYGSLRDLCIGLTYALPDGTVGRSGGKVIKNVAGYDLAKVFTGARGRYGAVAELSLRLHPICRDELSLRFEGDADRLVEQALALRDRSLAPTGVTYQESLLWVRLEGEREALEVQAERIETLMGAPGERLTTEESRTEWARVNEGRRDGPGETTAVAAVLPSRMAIVVRGAQAAARRAQVDLRLIVDPLGGALIGHVCKGSPVQHAQWVSELRADTRGQGGHLRVRARIPGVRTHVDLEGPLPKAAPVMKAVADALDPGQRCMVNCAFGFM